MVTWVHNASGGLYRLYIFVIIDVMGFIPPLFASVAELCYQSLLFTSLPSLHIVLFLMSVVNVIDSYEHIRFVIGPTWSIFSTAFLRV